MHLKLPTDLFTTVSRSMRWCSVMVDEGDNCQWVCVRDWLSSCRRECDGSSLHIPLSYLPMNRSAGLSAVIPIRSIMVQRRHLTCLDLHSAAASIVGLWDILFTQPHTNTMMVGA